MIPKIIHFVWAGNNDTMPEYSLETVNKWAQQNPDHTIWIWVDNKTTSAEILEKGYQALLSQNKNILTKDINELKDIDPNGKGWEIIRYEIGKLLPNYGASSDLLRYLILYVYGGIYLDSDNPPGKLSLKKLLTTLVPDTSLFVYPFTQGSFGIGNDVFICQKNNLIMKKIYEVSIANYSPEKMELFAQKTQKIRAPLKNKKDFTIEFTGPQHVRNTLLLFEEMQDARDREEEPVETLDYYDTLPKNFIDTTIENQTEWLKTTVKSNSKIDENSLVKKIIESIKFEAKYLGVFDPEHYVQLAITALSLDTPEKKKIFSLALLKELTDQTFEKINYISFEELEDYFFEYYTQHFPKIMVDVDHIRQVSDRFSFQIESAPIDLVEISVRYIEFISKRLNLEKNIPLKILLCNWSAQLKQDCVQEKWSLEKKPVDMFFDEIPEDSEGLDSNLVQFSPIFSRKVRETERKTVIQDNKLEISERKIQNI